MITQETAADMLTALEAISSNPHCDLGDLVYKVRESEGEGWDGPCVIAWSNAVDAVRNAIGKAKGEFKAHQIDDATEANANLVFAAPDMLEALKAERAWRIELEDHEAECMYCSGCEGGGCPWDGWTRRDRIEDMKRAAIMKAEGRHE